MTFLTRRPMVSAPMPAILFFLANTDHPIDSNHPLWHHPLPDRKAVVSPGSADQGTATVTYGDYFKAVADFCTSNAWEPILRATGQKRRRRVAEKEISRLSIFLEKHGALYHPARLLVTTPDQALAFVVNVAVSAEGRRTLPVEMRALERLGDQRPFGWLPAVYGSAVQPIPMFLGDWFDGYHEFHLTRRDGKEDPSLMVWDGAEEPTLLTEKQTADLYRQATMILAACYDPITTDQIFPWHHAAGDFVIRVEGNTVDVKLITVRNHAPIPALATAPEDERALLDNLLAFWIHLSIRMRLDRIDGVSEIAWAPEACLAPMIDGFFKGLDLTCRLSGLPEMFPFLFQTYFNHHGEARLTAMAKQMVETGFDRQSEERRIVNRHLEDHLHQICRWLTLRKSD
jgi:hypothetical protein